MSASINDPFLLSSYALSPRLARPTPTSSSSETPSSRQCSHLLVNHRHTLSNEKDDGLVTVAVQGDGVHVLDLSTLHPAISHTLGPSVTFSCPPATRTTRKDGITYCTTFAVIDSSPETLPEDRGRNVWAWEEQITGGVMSGDVQKKRKSALMPHAISYIYAPDDLPDLILVVSHSGELTVADMDLNLQPTLTEQQIDAESVMLKHFVFPRTSCSFVPNRSVPSHGVIAVSVLKCADHLQLIVVAIDREGETQPVGDCEISLNDPNVAEISFSPSGCLTVLTRAGIWSSFQLHPNPASPSSSFTTSPLTESLHLSSLTFIYHGNDAVTSSSDHRLAELSLLALTSSHVLLSGILTGGQPEIVLLLWDVQYGVLLTEQRCSVPSTLGRTRHRGIHMELVAASDGQALLALSPSGDSTRPNDGSALCSSVLVVPYIVPSTSTIANARGRAAAGQAWLKALPMKMSVQPGGMDAGQAWLLSTLSGMLDHRKEQEAERVFVDWVKEQEAVLGAQEAEGPKPYLGYIFVKRLLDIVLKAPPEESTSGDASANAAPVVLAYLPKLTRFLLEKRAVSNGMVEGGLIAALRMRQDWQSITVAMETVSDLPETDIITLLAETVTRHRQSASHEDAMQVDLPSGTFSLLAFLALCINYPTSPAALRVALHQQLSEAGSLVAVLDALDGWVEHSFAQEIQLLPDGLKKDAHSILVPVYVESKKVDLPPVDKVLSFIQAILDASFLTLLAHKPAHKLLRTLLSRLQPELAVLSELEALRGPLQPFAKTHAHAVHEGAHGIPKVDTSVDWRRRKKATQQQAEMALGLYQMEELVI
ncbi:uncharacterized protein LAESUDRAFT_655546 [Laetiporus sulphureus 93-53]|uniref:Uncharacterized protein n=1 Tax=Laetiporus sulphureus 93-53 TaxID=1314785 RepID=A0A165DSQ1_9APHY|nr:uncharacterized protein LAESUDRAFT_655546 [Laetiporus sulphureus 93-53]KZT05551.1 hypothetical protein LAESUDRAFT_655546 [Laetiporus sulphureus 93-53]